MFTWRGMGSRETPVMGSAGEENKSRPGPYDTGTGLIPRHDEHSRRWPVNTAPRDSQFMWGCSKDGGQTLAWLGGEMKHDSLRVVCVGQVFLLGTVLEEIGISLNHIGQYVIDEALFSGPCARSIRSSHITHSPDSYYLSPVYALDGDY